MKKDAGGDNPAGLPTRENTYKPLGDYWPDVCYRILMETIEVKLFASLSEQLGLDEATLEYSSGQTVAQLWDQLSKGRPVPSNLLCARNMEYCKLDELVGPGDEVAFFPPVSGG